eukprot:gnl/MRDRNA2_/MRDRNA2_132961_c0_seq1.p1 gnl/MRDRNA2_/MRDRNA2_132961_c0~~gnl/MRDRNA2_/MRDRNA2_132961_c0_seq1.p1  ORF type:complete len:157 (+),score=35.42 gnl/MRDRNA2_/MRDRNA2_132961_c0_seq1:35-472(+)
MQDELAKCEIANMSIHVRIATLTTEKPHGSLEIAVGQSTGIVKDVVSPQPDVEATGYQDNQKQEDPAQTSGEKARVSPEGNIVDEPPARETSTQDSAPPIEEQAMQAMELQETPGASSSSATVRPKEKGRNQMQMSYQRDLFTSP